jgi:hypothetical protein
MDLHYLSSVEIERHSKTSMVRLRGKSYIFFIITTLFS